MPVRLRYKVQIAVSSSDAEEKDLGNNSFEVVNDEQNEGGSWKTIVAAGAVDVQIQLGNVADGTFLSVRTSAKDPTQVPSPIQLKLNSSGATAIDIEPVGTAKEGMFLITTSSLTALYISNPGTVAMQIIVSAAGD